MECRFLHFRWFKAQAQAVDLDARLVRNRRAHHLTGWALGFDAVAYCCGLVLSAAGVRESLLCVLCRA